MPDFPHITDVRTAAIARIMEHQAYAPVARILIEQRLPELLKQSDFGTIEVEVNGIIYIATVNRKKLCGMSARFNIEVGGVSFEITVDEKGIVFAQASRDGVGPKWKI